MTKQMQKPGRGVAERNGHHRTRLNWVEERAGEAKGWAKKVGQAKGNPMKGRGQGMQSSKGYRQMGDWLWPRRNEGSTSIQVGRKRPAERAGPAGRASPLKSAPLDAIVKKGGGGEKESAKRVQPLACFILAPYRRGRHGGQGKARAPLPREKQQQQQKDSQPHHPREAEGGAEGAVHAGGREGGKHWVGHACLG